MMSNIEDAWDRLTPTEQERIFEDHSTVQRELETQGKIITHGRLRPGSEARTVRMDADGRVTVTDGPFTETREVMGGYYILECASMDEAVQWARRLRFMGRLQRGASFVGLGLMPPLAGSDERG
jgi:hypothetical protein